MIPVMFDNLLWNLLCECDIQTFQCPGKVEITNELIKNKKIKIIFKNEKENKELNYMIPGPARKSVNFVFYKQKDRVDLCIY